MKGNDNVKTAIRWRPKTAGQNVTIEKVTKNIVCVLKTGQTFMFDNVFDSSNQTEVFNALMMPLIDKAIEGFDCTFLAYGQTGSGKTYTMGFEGSVNPEHAGIATRTLNYLFNHENASKFKMTVSFVEIYNDQAFDLFGDDSPFYIKKGLIGKSSQATRKSVKSESEVQTLLLAGSKKRKSRSTNMNSNSSRSHAIFTIYLGTENRQNVKRESIINLVDLAGSEGFRKNENMKKEARAECKNINEGLLAFKRVIDAMAKQRNHIPSRESAITTILKDSINIQSYLTLLGCVNPNEDDYGESLSTLKFVVSAKSLKMTPAINKCIEDYQISKTPVKETEGKRLSLAVIPHKTSYFKTPTSFKKPQSIIRNTMSLSAKEKSAKRLNYVPFGSSSTSKAIGHTKRANQMHWRNGSFSHQTRVSNTATNLFPDESANDTFQNAASIDVNFTNVLTSSAIELYPTVNETQQSNENAQHNTLAIVNLLQTCLNSDKARNLVNSPLRKELFKNFEEMVRQKTGKPNNKGQNEGVKGDVKPDTQTLKDELQSFTPLPSSPPKTTAPIETSITAPSLDWNTVVYPSADAAANDIQPNLWSDEVNLSMNINQSSNEIQTLTTNDHIMLNNVPPCNEKPIEWSNRLEVIKEISEMNSVDSTVQDSVQKSVISSTNVELSAHNSELDETVNSELIAKSCYEFDNTVQTENHGNIAKSVTPLFLHKKKRAEISSSSIYEVIKRDSSETKTTPTMPSPNYGFDMQTHEHNCIESSFESLKYDSPENSAIDEIASKAPANYARFPYSPVIILHRINNMQQYQQSLKRRASHSGRDTIQNSKRPRATQTNSSKINKSKLVLKKSVANKAKNKSKTSTSTVVNAASNQSQSQKILHILNNGGVENLKTLHTIGPKKAEQIFTYRAIHGTFGSIDAMKKMQFWSDNMHKRFLINNFLV